MNLTFEEFDRAYPRTHHLFVWCKNDSGTFELPTVAFDTDAGWVDYNPEDPAGIPITGEDGPLVRRMRGQVFYAIVESNLSREALALTLNANRLPEKPTRIGI